MIYCDMNFVLRYDINSSCIAIYRYMDILWHPYQGLYMSIASTSPSSACFYWLRPKKMNAEFPLTLPKKLGRSVGNKFYLFLDFICYFMRTLVEKLIFILFHKVLSKLFNDQHFCSPHSVVLHCPFSSV